MQGVKKHKELSRNNEYIKIGQKTSVIRKNLQFLDLPGLSMHCSEVIFGPQKLFNYLPRICKVDGPKGRLKISLDKQ